VGKAKEPVHVGEKREEVGGQRRKGRKKRMSGGKKSRTLLDAEGLGVSGINVTVKGKRTSQSRGGWGGG